MTGSRRQDRKRRRKRSENSTEKQQANPTTTSTVLHDQNKAPEVETAPTNLRGGRPCPPSPQRPAEWALVVVGFLSFVVLAKYTSYMKGQLDELVEANRTSDSALQAQVDANKTSVSTLRLNATAQNPRLEIVSIEPIPPPMISGTRMNVRVWIKNVGATPAIDIDPNLEIAILPARLDSLAHRLDPYAHLDRLEPGEAHEWAAISNLIDDNHVRLEKEYGSGIGVSARALLRYHNILGDELLRHECRDWDKVDGTWGPCRYGTNGQGLYLTGPDPRAVPPPRK